MQHKNERKKKTNTKADERNKRRKKQKRLNANGIQMVRNEQKWNCEWDSRQNCMHRHLAYKGL